MRSELLALLYICVTCFSQVLATIACNPETLAQYKITFQGLWTKTRFPKVYPELRPKAEWSSLIGRSHSAAYNLFSKGELVNSRLQRFVEYGDSSQLDGEGQGHSLILDSFSAQALDVGYGTSEAQFFSDSSRHKVSFAAKIIPSPDWFVGIDGYALCQDGEWVDSVQFDIWPLDAGSQRGYTFSSPRWRSDPQEVITEMTGSYPNHTADAFYYPHLETLPPIAKVSISRMQTYQVQHDLNREEPMRVPVPEMKPNHTDHSHALNVAAMVKPPVPHFTRTRKYTLTYPLMPALHSLTSSSSESTTSTTTATSATTRKSEATPNTDTTTVSTLASRASSTTPPSEVTLNQRIVALLDEIRVRGMEASTTPHSLTSRVRQITTESTSTRAHTTPTSLRYFDDEATEYPVIEGIGMEIDDVRSPVERVTPPQLLTRDTTGIATEDYQSNKILPADSDPVYAEKACLVTEWTEWNACSRTCGYGMKMRTRDVTRWTGNMPCPELKQELLCGSMKRCNWNHFSLKFNSSKSIFGNQQRMRQKKIKPDAIVGIGTNSTGALTGHSGSFKRRYRIRTTPKAAA